MTWDGPILTDSGGFQVFSLAQLRKIKEEGVTLPLTSMATGFLWGRRRACRFNPIWALILRGPFDECIENPSPRAYVQQSCARTFRWLERCKRELNRLNGL